MKITDTSCAEHYRWGTTSDGWHLLKRDDVSVIQEQVPPGDYEVCHYHTTARQFFYVLVGEATLDIAGEIFVLRAHQGIDVPPNIPHQFRNDSTQDVTFLVISVPKAHGDRVEI